MPARTRMHASTNPDLPMLGRQWPQRRSLGLSICSGIMLSLAEGSNMKSTLSLYRFERFEEKRLAVVESNQLWLASPRTFNDLEDCLLRLNFIDTGRKDIGTLRAAAQALYGSDLSAPVSGVEPEIVLDVIQLIHQSINPKSTPDLFGGTGGE